MVLHVKDAKYLGEYKVEVVFDDGRSGTADLCDVLRGPVFEVLKDRELFSLMKVDEMLRTIVWPNGVDLAPEFIYFKAFSDDPDLQDKFKEWGYLG